MIDEKLVESARDLSFKNKKDIQAETTCGCYYCCRTFTGNEIKEWVDGGTTAMCPHCNIDSVVPGMINKNDLEEAHLRWFRTYRDLQGNKIKDKGEVCAVEKEK